MNGSDEASPRCGRGWTRFSDLGARSDIRVLPQGGTGGSNPAPSSGESTANSVSGTWSSLYRRPDRQRTLDPLRPAHHRHPWSSCSRPLPAVYSASRQCSPTSPCSGFPSLPASSWKRPAGVLFRNSGSMGKTPGKWTPKPNASAPCKPNITRARELIAPPVVVTHPPPEHDDADLAASAAADHCPPCP